MRTVLVLALLLGVPHYRHDGKAALPDPKLTPGHADRRLTAAKLCSAKFTTRDERHVTEGLKKQVCAEYGITTGCPGKGYEIDHLISIELGGAEDITNLWPQPADTCTVTLNSDHFASYGTCVIGFRTKDKVENRAHRAVCSGKLTLTQAQKGISGDWYKFAQDNDLLK